MPTWQENDEPASRVHMVKARPLKRWGGEGEQYQYGVIPGARRKARCSPGRRVPENFKGDIAGRDRIIVEHRRSVEDDESVTPENLLRLSVGLESKWDLLSDLEMALKASSI